VPTRHTHKWDGLNTRHLLESTHTQTHTHTNNHTTRPDADSRRGGALLTRGGRLAPTPSKEAASDSVAISHAEAMCTARAVSPPPKLQRRCACSASHIDVDQLTCLRSRTAVSLACSAPCPASVGRATPPARSSRLRSRRAAPATKSVTSPCPSVTARGRIPASCTRRSRRRCGAKSCHYPRRQQCP
jgi:hypothetical protein